MTRKPKNSHHSFQFCSSKHDYNGSNTSQYQSQSQSPYESNEEDDDVEQPMGSESATNTPIDDQFSNSFSTNYTQPNSHPINSYINIAPFPIFHGQPNECPISHLSRFIKVCRANNASSTDSIMRIFPVTLENEAALWYDLNIEPYPSLSWDEIKISFLDAYNRIEIVDQLRSDLMNLRQGNEECVRSYFLRLQWILKRWPDHGLAENIIKGIFIDGLIKDFRDWIIPQKPNSLNEALSLAFSFEQVKNIKGVRQKVVKCGFCEGSHEEKWCEVRKRMRELLRKSNKESESDEAGKEIAEKGEENEEGMFSWKKTEKSHCQCSKHQCWKKKLHRNNSIVTRNSNTND